MVSLPRAYFCGKFFKIKDFNLIWETLLKSAAIINQYKTYKLVNQKTVITKVRKLCCQLTKIIFGELSIVRFFQYYDSLL